MNSNDSLRDRALLANTAHMNSLEEIFRACDQNQTFRDSCSMSENFWKETLKRFFGPTLVDQRGDLVGGDVWEEFASNLATGVVYKYSIWEDTETGNIKLPLRPYYNSYEADDDIDADLMRYVLEIPAQIPSSESFGYVYTMYFLENMHEKQFSDFIMDVDPKEAFELCLRMTCEKITNVANTEQTVAVFKAHTGWKARRVQVYYGRNPININEVIYEDSIDTDNMYLNLLAEINNDDDVFPRINNRVTIVADHANTQFRNLRLDNPRVTMSFDINIHPIRFA